MRFNVFSSDARPWFPDECKANKDTYLNAQVRNLGKIIDPEGYNSDDNATATATDELNHKELLKDLETDIIPSVKKVKMSTDPTPKKAKIITDADLGDAFQSLSVGDYYGTLTPSEINDFNDKSDYSYHEIQVLYTEAQPVGDFDDDVIKADVITINLKRVDKRWFTTDLEDFEPVKLVQIGPKLLAVRLPTCTYDKLFAPFPGPDGKYSREDCKSAYLMGTHGEQLTLDTVRNRFKINEPETWSKVYGLRFNYVSTRLDYVLLNKKKQSGEVDFEFCGSSLDCSLKWRIAVVPKNKADSTVRKKKPKKHHNRSKLQEFETRRLAFENDGTPDVHMSSGVYKSPF